MATTTTVTKVEISSTSPYRRAIVEQPIANATIFRSLKQREIDDLVSSGWTVRFARGQVIYCAGDELQHLYVIESGSVKLIKSSDEGKELIVGLVGLGESFGSIAHSQATGTLSQALEDSRIFLLPHQSIRRIAVANPSFSLDLLRVSEQRFFDIQTVAARLAFDTVPHRLSQLLIKISEPSHGMLRYPVNQTEMANLIGSSRETVCSVLSRLRRGGMISINKGRIRILQRERLASVR